MVADNAYNCKAILYHLCNYFRISCRGIHNNGAALWKYGDNTGDVACSSRNMAGIYAMDWTAERVKQGWSAVFSYSSYAPK